MTHSMGPSPLRQPSGVVAGDMQAALSLVPGLTFLMHEAHRAELWEIAETLSNALTEMTHWIECNSGENCNEERTVYERH